MALSMPSPGLNLHLDTTEFQIAVKWWLGMDVFNGGKCSFCLSKLLDPLGHRGGDVMKLSHCSENLGVKIVRGHRFLGGFIGEEEDVHAFVLEKVKTWTSGVGVLAEAAELYPQAAFAALSKSLQFQWVLPTKSGTKL